MSFDWLAPHYRWLEALLAGPTMQRARTAWSPLLSEARAVLLAGEGHGRGVVDVLRAAPQARVTVVDASEPMLNVARDRVRRHGLDVGAVQWQRADLTSWTADTGRYDALVTHFFLDCFAPEDLARVTANLARAATADAAWFVADFCVPADGWRRRRAEAIHALMYACFRPTTRISARRLTPPGPLLAAHGFHRTRHRTFCAGLVHSDVWRR